ncbi:glycoside hydrolase family 16 protein [Flagellimonas sp.]|uniref:glycoside hydrolase family 16 protein n=1 Tax=Flagellimonas sp. TaxID=2058762 RepID=UPI003F4A7CB6
MKEKKQVRILVVLLSGVLFFNCSSNQSDEPIVLEASCFDSVMNGDETGVDCGGNCPNVCDSEPVSIPTSGFVSPTAYDGFTLTWSDEFNSAQLDQEKWDFHLGDGCPALCNWGNNEEQFFTNSSDNIYLDRGNLIITAIDEFRSGKNYTSSRIHTDEKFEFKYGRVDIRASMPSAPGTWVALFMFNKDYTILDPDAFWPSGGEIDIMEYLGEDPNNILGTAHFGTDFPANWFFESSDFSAPNGVSYDSSYYVFSIIWEEDKITWLVNDMEYHSIDTQTTSDLGQPYPFNDEFYFVFALSVGGNLPSVSPTPSDFPDSLIVDYVRVFQKN